MTVKPNRQTVTFNLTAQRGVGLVEVLVALLLLGVAALGFAALQGQSLKSTDEALTRTQAITLIRSTAEKMRTNGLGVTYSIDVTPDPSAPDAPPAKQPYAALDYYQTLFNQTAIPTAINCNTNGCTPEQIATNDVHEIRTSAASLGLKMGIDICPGTGAHEKSKCIIASWNGTEPKKGSGSTDCMSDAGTYRFNADCVFMEAY